MTKKKRMGIIVGAVLVALAVALSVVLAACGDSTFNIPDDEPATDADLKEFITDVSANADRMDSATGLPAMIAGKSYEIVLNASLEYKYEGDYKFQRIDMNADGIVNFAEDITMELTGSLVEDLDYLGQVSKARTEATYTLVDGVIYSLVETEDETVRRKQTIDLSWLRPDDTDAPAGGAETPSAPNGLPEQSIPDEDEGTTETTESESAEIGSVSELIAQVREGFASVGMDVTPQLYIYNGVLRMDLGGDSYIGLAFDDSDHTFEAFALVLDDMNAEAIMTDGPLAILLPLSHELSEARLSLTFNIRKAGYRDVEAPDDASDYIEE